MVGVGVSVNVLPACGTFFFLLSCHVQPAYKGLYLFLLHLFMKCLVHIPRMSTLFWKKKNKEWEVRLLGTWRSGRKKKCGRNVLYKRRIN